MCTSKKTVMITGMDKDRGGVESVIYNIVCRLRSRYSFTVLKTTSDLAAYQNELENNGARFLYTSKIFGLQSIFRRRQTIRHILQSNHVDLMLVNGTSILSMYMILAANDAGIPSVFVMHNLNTSDNRTYRKVINYVGAIFLRLKVNSIKHSTLLAVSSLVRDQKLNGFKNVMVLNNGLDTEQFVFDNQARFLIREHYGIPTEARVLIMVARISPVKNHRKALDIIEKGISDGSFDYAFLVGGGDANDYLNEVRKSKLSDRVFFTGDIRNVTDYLSASDVAIQTSFSEGLGLSLLEYQANGLPVVCSDGIPHEVKVLNSLIFLSVNDPEDVWIRTIKKQLAITNNSEDRIKDNIILKNSKFQIDSYIKAINSIFDTSLRESRGVDG